MLVDWTPPLPINRVLQNELEGYSHNKTSNDWKCSRYPAHIMHISDDVLMKPGQCSINQCNMTLCCHYWVKRIINWEKNPVHVQEAAQFVGLQNFDFNFDTEIPRWPGTHIGEMRVRAYKKSNAMLCVKCPSAPSFHPLSRQRSAVKKTSSKTHDLFLTRETFMYMYADSGRWLEMVRRDV